MLAAAVLLVAILYARPYPVLLAVVALVGALSQTYRPAAASLLAQVTPPSRQVMVFAMSRLALNLGTTAAPLLGAALITISYNLLFWGEAVASLGCVAVMLLLVPSRPAAAGRRGTAPDPPADGADLPDARVPGPDGKPSRHGGYLAIAADRRYLLYLVAVTANCGLHPVRRRAAAGDAGRRPTAGLVQRGCGAQRPHGHLLRAADDHGGVPLACPPGDRRRLPPARGRAGRLLASRRRGDIRDRYVAVVTGRDHRGADYVCLSRSGGSGAAASPVHRSGARYGSEWARPSGPSSA